MSDLIKRLRLWSLDLTAEAATALEQQAGEIERLKAEHAELRKAAERWRFFLSTRPPGTHEVIVEALDAAMEGKK